MSVNATVHKVLSRCGQACSKSLHIQKTETVEIKEWSKKKKIVWAVSYVNTFSFLAQIAARRRWRSPHWVSVSGQWVSVGPTRSFFFAFKEKTVGGKFQFGWPFNNFLPSHKIANVLQSSCLGPIHFYIPYPILPYQLCIC